MSSPAVFPCRTLLAVVGKSESCRFVAGDSHSHFTACQHSGPANKHLYSKARCTPRRKKLFRKHDCAGELIFASAVVFINRKITSEASADPAHSPSSSRPSSPCTPWLVFRIPPSLPESPSDVSRTRLSLFQVWHPFAILFHLQSLYTKWSSYSHFLVIC